MNVEELEALREYEAAGKWQRGTAGNADLVRYDGDDIAGIASVGNFTRIDYIAALHNAAPDLFAAKRRLDALEEAIQWAKGMFTHDDLAALKDLLTRADQIAKERSK